MGIFSWGDEPFLDEPSRIDGLKRQLALTPHTLKELSKHGVTIDSYLKLELFFYTNKKAKANGLAKALKAKGYSIDQIKKGEDGAWLVSGWSNRMNMSNYSVMAWVQEMCEVGFNHDCEFDGWGTSPKEMNRIEVDEKLSGDNCYNQALDLYREGKHLSALAYFSRAIELNDQDFEAYYSRAVTKGELNNKEGAIADYTSAIKIKPDYESALGNRGADIHDLGDYEGAIADYNALLKINPKSTLAFRNRGNTYYCQEQLTKACEDWKTAASYGDESAKESLDRFCSDEHID